MSRKISMPNKEELKEKYSQFGTTISSLAREYGVSNPVLRGWLIQAGIERKSQKEASTQANNRSRTSPPPKEILDNLYLTKSIKDLATIFSVGQETIYEWFELYGIKSKSVSEGCKIAKELSWNSRIPSKEKFIEEYERTKNLKALETVFDLSTSSIKRLVKDYDIETHKPWRSVAEIELHARLESLTGLKWAYSDKTMINPYELDMVLHEKKLAVEYCGLYWHSEYNGEKTKDYHLKKLNLCKEKGYGLITVFESDDQNKVLSIIQNKLGLSKKIYARNCEIALVSLTNAKIFNNENHLHNHHSGSVNIGLYYQNKLVMLVTMGKSRFNKSYDWECVRMTSLMGTTVIGGASRLFSYFVKTYNPSSMITYADKRFGEGSVYLNCGFVKCDDTNPNYWYFSTSKTNQLLSRIVFQKHKLKNFISYDKSLTEWEIMKASGYDRIWDCGNAKYIWRK